MSSGFRRLRECLKTMSKFLADCYCDFGSHLQLWSNFLEIQRENSYDDGGRDAEMEGVHFHPKPTKDHHRQL